VKNKKSIFKLFAIFASLQLIYFCKHTPEIPPAPPVSFATQVQPILVANCTMSGCHSSNSGNDLFPLVTYADVTGRNLVAPGDPKASRLYRSITGAGEDLMPPGRSLSNDNILLTYLWIAQGAKNN
jgi:hypothetical protein